jgi:hypothetical protein
MQANTSWTPAFNSMDQSSAWKADSPSAAEKRLLILWNSNAYCLADRRLPLVPVLSQMNATHFFHSSSFNLLKPSGNFTYRQV